MNFDELVESPASHNHDMMVIADADLSAKQYQLIQISSAGYRAAVLGSGGAPIGVLMNAPVAGQMAQIRLSGFARLKVSGTVSRHDPLKVDTGSWGQANKFTKGTDGHAHVGGGNPPPQAASTQLIVGWAMEDATAGQTPIVRLMWQLF